MDQTLETSELTMINTVLRETGSIGQIHSFKGHAGGHSTGHRILAQHAWSPGFNARHKPIKLKGGILRSNLLHSFTNSVNIQQACYHGSPSRLDTGNTLHSTKVTRMLSRRLHSDMLICPFPVNGMGYNCGEPQFAGDSRKASWDRIWTQKDWGFYHPAGALWIQSSVISGHTTFLRILDLCVSQGTEGWPSVGGHHWVLRAGTEPEGRTGWSVLSSSLTPGAEGDSVLSCVWCCWSPDIHNYAESTKSPGTQTFKWHR